MVQMCFVEMVILVIGFKGRPTNVVPPQSFVSIHKLDLIFF